MFSDASRRSSRVAISATLAVALALGLVWAPATAATTKACLVINKATGARHARLQTAVNKARPGHKLVVKGTCKGETNIGKNLIIKGRATRKRGRPTLVGTKYGGPLVIRGNTKVWVKSLTARRDSSYQAVITNHGVLKLKDVVVRGGSRGGGGITNNGSLKLTGQTRVTGNNGGYSGGGVDNEGALFLFDSASISGNTAINGGGVDNDGKLVLTGSSFISNNTATVGGGVFSWSGSSIVLRDDARIRANTAYTEGGGVRTLGGALTMTGSSAINGNTATTGGGIWTWDADDLSGVTCGANVRGNKPDNCHLEWDL